MSRFSGKTLVNPRDRVLNGGYRFPHGTGSVPASYPRVSGSTAQRPRKCSVVKDWASSIGARPLNDSARVVVYTLVPRSLTSIA